MAAEVLPVVKHTRLPPPGGTPVTTSEDMTALCTQILAESLGSVCFGPVLALDAKVSAQSEKAIADVDPEQQDAAPELVARAEAVLWVEPGTHAVSRHLGALREQFLPSFRVVAPCTHHANRQGLHRGPALQQARDHA